MVNREDNSFVSINHSNLELLREFLDNAGLSLSSFRYFQSRPLSIIQNHLVTLLYMEESKPVAYGHLDVENGVTWLGIAVSQKSTGKGFGKVMLTKLLNEARKRNIKSIQLTVDNDNEVAIKLYSKFNFKMLKKNEKISFMQLILD